MKIEKLKESIYAVTDPRRLWGNPRHKLEDIRIIGLCSIICQGEDYEDMEIFGNERKEWLKTFLELPNGIPDSDTFRRVFEKKDCNRRTRRLICLSITVGLVLSLLIEETVGIVCGGAIVSGYLAIVCDDIVTMLFVFLIAMLVYLVVEFVLPRFVLLFGERKFIACLLVKLVPGDKKT